MWLANASDLSDQELQSEIDACGILLDGDTPQAIREEAERDLEELIQEKRRRASEVYPLESMRVVDFIPWF